MHIGWTTCAAFFPEKSAQGTCACLMCGAGSLAWCSYFAVEAGRFHGQQRPQVETSAGPRVGAGLDGASTVANLGTLRVQANEFGNQSLARIFMDLNYREEGALVFPNKKVRS